MTEINKKYSIKNIKSESDEDWLYLGGESIDYTPFCDEEYLNAAGFEGRRVILFDKDKPVLGLCMPINENGVPSSVPYAPYQGLIYAKLHEDKYKDNKFRLDYASFLLEKIDEQYKDIFIANNYTVSDVRPFAWHNYHQPERGTYDIKIRYTAIKDISSIEYLLKGLSKGRKLDYRYSVERYGIKYIESNNFAEFFRLYNRTFERQGIVLSEQDYSTVEKIIRCTKNRNGLLRYALNACGEIVSAIYVLVGNNNTAYYLFGASDPEYRKQGGNTFLLIELMKELSEKGIAVFDFVGVNSPQRGDYKMSFGAFLKPYYVCSKG